MSWSGSYATSFPMRMAPMLMTLAFEPTVSCAKPGRGNNVEKQVSRIASVTEEFNFMKMSCLDWPSQGGVFCCGLAHVKLDAGESEFYNISQQKEAFLTPQ